MAAVFFAIATTEISKGLLLKTLTHHLSTVKGFKTCNLYIDMDSAEIVDMLQSQLTKLFPTVTMRNDASLEMSKFTRADFLRQTVIPMNREQPGIMNYASGCAILIFVIGWNETSSQRNVKDVYQKLAHRSSIPKVLILSITDERQHNYAQLFGQLTLWKILDVEILEASVSHDDGNCSFVLHSYNPFSKVSTSQNLTTANVQVVPMFEPKLKNLYGHCLKTYKNRQSVVTYNISINPNYWWDKLYVWHIYGLKSYFALHVMTSMNVTFSLVNFTANDQVAFSAEADLGLDHENFSTLEHARHTWLKPRDFLKANLFTPVILDSKINVQFKYSFLCYFGCFGLVLLLLHVCRVIGNFNRRTWSPNETVKMMFGLSSPYSPKLPIEFAIFYLISVSGIFTSNFLSDQLTGMLIPLEEERVFKTFDELKASNVTLFLEDDPEQMDNITFGEIENVIRKSGVLYKVESLDDLRFSLIFARMLTMRNKSVSIHTYGNVISHDRTIEIDGKARARRSDLLEFSYVCSYHVQDFSPYRERISDLYWRFGESGFGIYTNFLRMYFRFALAKFYEEFVMQYESQEEREINQLTSIALWCILIVGTLLSVIVLYAEIHFEFVLF